MPDNKFIKFQVLHKRTSFQMKVKDDITLGDIKYMIEKHENISMIYYNIFLEDINLLDTYNNYLLKRVLEMTGQGVKYENDNHEYILYLISRDDYKNLTDQINCLRCEIHTYNTAYLFCFTCCLLICDQCRVTEHKTHSKVTDQALCLDAYFLKLQQYENKFRNLFGKSKENDLKEKCLKMERKLGEYINYEKKEVMSLANEMKNTIDRIRDLELKRLDNIAQCGKSKIFEFEDEGMLAFKMYKMCNDGLQTRKQDLEAFSRWGTKQKVEYLKKIQKKNTQMIEKNGWIEKVMEKFKNAEDYDITSLLSSNKDYSYIITFTKLKQIFEKKIEKIEYKLNSENGEALLSKMGAMKTKAGNSKIYNQFLNLADGNVKCDYIIQQIDLTNMVNVFKIKEQKIFTLPIKFVFHKGLTEVNEFPKFSRGIMINGKLYVSGGELDSSVLNYLLEVDIETLEAKVKKGMEYRRSAHTLVNINNLKIVAISGAYGEKSCESYLIEQNFWSTLPFLKEDRIGACTLLYCSESIYVFFGKKYDSINRKWIYVDSVERIQLYEHYPEWKVLQFKAVSLEVVRERAFSSVLACPNEKLLILGGQTMEDGDIKICTDVLEIDIELQTIGLSPLSMPKESCFVDNNFYFHSSNGINFDNEGAILMYSIIFNEIWFLENF